MIPFLFLFLLPAPAAYVNPEHWAPIPLEE
jgi:hypothetical protein